MRCVLCAASHLHSRSACAVPTSLWLTRHCGAAQEPAGMWSKQRERYPRISQRACSPEGSQVSPGDDCHQWHLCSLPTRCCKSDTLHGNFGTHIRTYLHGLTAPQPIEQAYLPQDQFRPRGLVGSAPCTPIIPRTRWPPLHKATRNRWVLVACSISRSGLGSRRCPAAERSHVQQCASLQSQSASLLLAGGMAPSSSVQLLPVVACMHGAWHAWGLTTSS
jgi:hypothetical protein